LAQDAPAPDNCCCINFEDLWAQATQIDLGPTRIRIASREHLIEMKAAAGRPQDLADIQRLRDR